MYTVINNSLNIRFTYMADSYVVGEIFKLKLAHKSES